MLTPGRQLPVYVDRKEHSRFTIDWGGTGAPPTTLTQEGVSAAASTTAVQEPEQPLGRLQKLMELKNAQMITDEEFQRQKTRIIEDI